MREGGAASQQGHPGEGGVALTALAHALAPPPASPQRNNFFIQMMDALAHK